MSIILTTPVIIPARSIKVQQIEGVHIDYSSRSVSITIGDYPDNISDIPENLETFGYPLDEITTPENIVHFKYVFRAIREHAIAQKFLREGVDTEAET